MYFLLLGGQVLAGVWFIRTKMEVPYRSIFSAFRPTCRLCADVSGV